MAASGAIRPAGGQPAVRVMKAADGGLKSVRSVAALPPDVAGQFAEPAGFAQLPSGDYLLFDRRAHTVFRVDRGLESARRSSASASSRAAS